MSAKQLTEISQLMKDGNYNQALKICKQIEQSDPMNATVATLIANCLNKLEDYQTSLGYCQNLLNNLKHGTDDKLIFQVLTVGIEASGNLMQRGNQRQRQDFENQNIQFHLELVEFLERKEKWDKFQLELEELAIKCQQAERYDELEKIYLRSFQNDKLENKFRQKCAILIFTMSVYHKPKIALTLDLKREISILDPQNEDLVLLSEKLLKDLDKNIPLQVTSLKQEQAEKYTQDCQSYLELTQPLYLDKDFNDSAFLDSLFKDQMPSYFKFLIVSSLHYEESSDKYKQLIETLKKVVESKQFQEADEVEHKSQARYPLISLIRAILTTQSLLDVVNPTQSWLDTKGQDYVEKEMGILRKMIKTKILIYLGSLLVNPQITLTQEKKKKFFETCVQQLQACKDKEISNKHLIFSNLPKLQYLYSLSMDDWKAAKKVLDDLCDEQQVQENQSESHAQMIEWAKVQKAWLSYSYLGDLANSEDDRILLMKGIVNTLKEVLAANPNNLDAQIKLGTLYFLYEKQLGLNAKQDVTLWLQALKKDQTNPEIFLSLGIYYFVKEKDIVRAQKCIDKACLLQTSNYDAQLLNFLILMKQGKQEQAYQNCLTLQRVSPLSVLPYYLMGLKALSIGNFQQALDNLLNGSRYHSFWLSQKQNLKSNYPKLQDAFALYSSNSQEFTYFERPLGIQATNDIAFWIHIADCYQKLDRNDTALKSVHKIHKELTPVLEQQIQILLKSGLNKDSKFMISDDKLNSLYQIIDALTQSLILQDQVQSSFRSLLSLLDLVYNATQDTKDRLDSILLFSDLSNLLLVTSQVFYKNRQYLSSMKFLMPLISLITLKTQNQSKNHQLMIQEVIILLLENMNKLVENDCKGNVDPKSIARNKYLKAAQQIHQIVDNLQVLGNFRFKRVSVETLKILGEETDDQQMIKQAIEIQLDIIDAINEKKGVQNDVFRRNQILDACKMMHLLRVRYNENSYDGQILKLIRGLITEQQENGQFWVYYGIFTTERGLKLKCFYKALQLNPKDQFAINNLLCTTLKEGNLKQAFSFISNLRDVESLNALYLAILTIFNARLALEQGDGIFIKKEQQKKYLEDAISLGQMFLQIEKEKISIEEKDTFDARIDIHQYLSNQINYLVTLMQFEHHEKDLNTNDLQELLTDRLQQDPRSEFADLLDKMHISSKLKGSASQIEQLMIIIEQQITKPGRNDTQSYIKIKEIILHLQTKDISFLQEQAQNAYEAFLRDQTTLNANQLIFANNLLMTNQNLKFPLQNLLDDSQFEHFLEQIDKETAANLLNQSLKIRFLQRPDQMTDLQEYFDLFQHYRLERLKQQLPVIEYGRIFKLYLLNSIPETKSLYIKEYKKIRLLGKRYLELFLNALDSQIMSKESLFADIMKRPSQLSGYLKVTWYSILEGKLDQAQRYNNLANQKIKAGVIRSITEKEKTQLADLGALITSLVSLDQGQIQNLQSITRDKINFIQLIIKIAKDREDLVNSNQDENREKIKKFAKESLVYCNRLSKDKPEILEDVLQVQQLLLQNIFLRQGHYSSFETLGTAILSKEQLQNLAPFFRTELQLFLMLNLAVASIANKKHSQVNSFKKQVSEIISKLKHIDKDAVNIIDVLQKFKIGQYAQSQRLLDIANEGTYEKEFLQCIYYHEMQQYKDFYLGTIGLVSSLKVDIITERQMQKTLISKQQELQRLNFLLGLAYLLKHKAEKTFQIAREQGFQLEDDFSERDSNIYNAQMLSKKSERSRRKALQLLKGHQQVEENFQS